MSNQDETANAVTRPVKKNPAKIIITIFVLLVVFAAVFILSAYFYTKAQIKPLYTSSQAASEEQVEKTKIEISMGTSVFKISEILEKNYIIRDSRFFYLFIHYPVLFDYFFPGRQVTQPIELKSGIYYLTPAMNYVEIVEALSSGRQEYIKVVIPEGLTISKIGELLEENGICSLNEFRKLCYDGEIVKKYNISGTSLEGFLFPDTYFLNPGMSAADVIEMMVGNFYEKVASIERLTGLTPEQLYEKVKLASIVEREYRIPDEAPLISSVFVNRLKYNIGLYSCATIEYILTEVLGRPHPDRILIEDTRIDSPYNTYLYAGLPPTPISNPGLISLNAAANPAKTKYYFFQIVDPEEGRHVFTSTFDEHKLSHNLYLKK